MRKRLSLVLVLLMAVVVLALGVPLAASIAGDETRLLRADRLADLTLFGSLVPPAGDPDQPDAAHVADVQTQSLDQDLRRYAELYDSEVTVVDTSGHTLYSSAAARGALPSDPRVVQAVGVALYGRQDDTSRRVLPWDDRPLVVGEPVIREGDVIGAVVSRSSTAATRHRELDRWLELAAAELAALAVAVVLAGRLSRWLLRPVRRLDEAVQQIAGGDLSARVPSGSGPPELRRLESTFNHMAANVEEAVEAQRAFVADASHQLRNPMAALLIRLEGLEMVPAEVVPAAARRALSDGRNLADTLDRMLELARIEHAGALPRTLDVAALVDDRLESWRVVAEPRSIRIRRIGMPAVSGHHEPGALAGAVDAVVDNAIKYSAEGGTVTVDLRAGEDHCAVVVTDDGPGVAADELPHLGERFWRSSQPDRPSGTGLGLSIARALMERCGGRLGVAPGEERGLAVSLYVRATADTPVREDQALARR